MSTGNVDARVHIYTTKALGRDRVASPTLGRLYPRGKPMGVFTEVDERDRTPSRRKNKINKIKINSIWTLPLCLLMHRPLGIHNCCFWVLQHFLTSYVISVASDIEREKSDKFCSEALISAWGSFTCRKYTTRDSRLHLPSEGSHAQDFYALKKSIDPGWDRTREPWIKRRVW